MISKYFEEAETVLLAHVLSNLRPGVLHASAGSPRRGRTFPRSAESPACPPALPNPAALRFDRPAAPHSRAKHPHAASRPDTVRLSAGPSPNDGLDTAPRRSSAYHCSSRGTE